MGGCVSTPVADGVAAIGPHPSAKTPSNPQAAAPTTAVPAKPDATQAQRQRQMQKRIAVAAEALTSASDVEIPIYPKTDLSRQLIKSAMAGNLLFQGLSLGARQAIVDSMKPQMVVAGEVIIAQGDDDATAYYIVDRGEFEVWVAKGENEPRPVQICSPGFGFGELALLYSAPRAATVRATTNGKLWVMQRSVYAAIKRAVLEAADMQKKEMLEAVPMLAVLAPEHQAAVADALEMVEFGDGDVICREGEHGDRFFTIKEGVVVVSKAGENVAKLGAGDYFGERALIREEPRAATVIAQGYVVCYALGKKAFDELLGPIEDVWRYESLRRAPILSNLSERQLFELARSVTRVEFAKGEAVFRQGDVGSTFYVVEEGLFAVTNAAGVELARCGKGKCFGELALLREEPRAATVTAMEPCKALACTREVFDRLLGGLQEIRSLWRFEALSKAPLLAGLTQQQRVLLCNAFLISEFAAGQEVVTQGDPGDAFFVVEKGECSVVLDGAKELARLGPASYFGERALLRNEPRAATVRAATDTTLLRLGRADFETLLGSLEAVLRQQTATYDVNLTIPKITKALSMQDFQHIAVLGSGAFGRVTLVRHEDRCYALKAMSKAHVVQAGLTAHIKREKAIMSELASPFLVSLAASFQDASSLYMVLEAVQGGELFAYLQSKERLLSEAEARFYAGCVVLGLEFMHDRGIAWRDLKPENLLLDSSGYLKITDFGFAKRIGSASRSYTLCGTPEYLAPELVTQAGHTRAVDWWAVGILIYEMVAGVPPFNQEERVAMFRAICNVSYRMPNHFSPALQDLVRQLLVRVPNRRLGCMQGGVAELKNHPWFTGFNWDTLAQRKMAAPYVPKVKGPEDASNFSAIHDTASRADTRYISTGIFKDF